MAVCGPLLLSGTTGTKNVFSSTALLPTGFNKAQVLYSKPKSLWVLYKVPQWDRAQSDLALSNSSVAGVITSKDQEVEYDADILSVQGFNIDDPGVILFEHNSCRGRGLSYRYSCPDITSSFPIGQIDGVSSAVVTGGQWVFFTGYNYTGIRIVVDGFSVFGPGKHEFLGEKNNIIKSVRSYTVQVSGPLVLKSEVGEQMLFDSTSGEDIEGGKILQADVMPSFPNSLWVLYSTLNFDHGATDVRGECKVDMVKTSTTIYPKSEVKSVQGFNIATPGIILFEHFEFRGYGTSMHYSCPDLTVGFPQGKVGGISSFIVTGGSWSFFTGMHYSGIKIILDGKSDFDKGEYDFSSNAEGNNQAMSLRGNFEHVASPLQLAGQIGTKRQYNAVESLEPGLTKAEIIPGFPDSIWVLYDNTSWNANYSSNVGGRVIFSKDKEVDFGRDICSVQGFNCVNPGIIFFQHPNFNGYSAVFVQSIPNLADYVPELKVGAINCGSAIITGGKWRFYSGVNQTGTLLTYNGSSEFNEPLYPDLSSIGEVASIEYAGVTTKVGDIPRAAYFDVIAEKLTH